MEKMTKEQVKERIEKLRKYIDDLRYRYHVLDDPSVTDAQWDSLMRELVKLENEYPEFKSNNSPSQKIGGEPIKEFKSVAHITPMLSLNDAFDEGELNDWYKRMARLVKEQELSNSGYYCEMKMDGLAVSIVYENGELAYALTRGNGKIGEDITKNVKTVKSIPLKLRVESKYYSEAKRGRFEVRGEIFMPKKSFDELNRKRKKSGESLFANPRNAAAGSLRQLDSKITSSRNLDFSAYAMIGINTKTHEDEHLIAQDLGFPSNKYNKFCGNIDEILKLWNRWAEIRPKLAYQIDGMVVVVNSKELFNKLGVVGKAPRGALALKWPAEEVTTQVEDIQVQVGRTGTLTPVAHLTPVNVAGSTVSRATLHNEDEINKKDIRIGDTVVVRKAGDVIPEVVKPILELRTGQEKKFSMPSVCPICGGAVERKAGEVANRCLNKNCFATQFRYLQYFVSKTAFDIDGLGPKILEQLLNEGLIKDAADLFTLTEGDLVPLERFAEKSAVNVINSIKEAKEISLPRFIYALGIRNVGEETAYEIVDFVNLKFKNKNLKLWNILSEISEGDWGSIYDIGPVVSKNIYSYFQNEQNLKFIRQLVENGVCIKELDKIEKKPEICDKTFVFTGGMDSMTRDDAKTLVRKYGGNVSESVSAKVDYVVTGEEAGSKLERAKKLGVKVISEDEFLQIIK